jgi:hypothetical protein
VPGGSAALHAMLTKRLSAVPRDPAVDRYFLLTGRAVHVTAYPGEGRATIVLLDVGVVLASGEMLGGVEDVGGEPARMGRRGTGTGPAS